MMRHSLNITSEAAIASCSCDRFEHGLTPEVEPLRGTGAAGYLRARLAGRAGREKLYLIAMIDNATSRFFARFARHDSPDENMKLLWSYVEKLWLYRHTHSLPRGAVFQRHSTPTSVCRSAGLCSRATQTWWRGKWDQDLNRSAN